MTSSVSFIVQPYSASNLADLFDEHSHDGAAISRNKSHVEYFNDYLTDIGAKTVIVEEPYTDKDYIEDYAAYYARCHAGYKKTCVRLHFFANTFDDAYLSDAVSGDISKVDALKENYLGFLVIKPLPETIIGRTCLKTYGQEGRDRAFPTVRTYCAHFLGIEFSVESVPFQEQDSDVAACATSAIWSALQATGKLFHHHIPTPAEITEAAAMHQRPSGRTLPAANGLSSEQMADAIKSIGLEPLLLKANDPLFLKVAVSAYLRAQIPAILIGTIATPTGPLGRHAVAAMGFSKQVAAPTPINNTLFMATAIDRIYVHDDQVGPFARLKFDAGQEITTSWPNGARGPRGAVKLAPELLLLPLYHKIRVPIDLVMNTIHAFDTWLEIARGGGLLPYPERIVWDIYLERSEQFKAELFASALSPEERVPALYANLPRFVWKAEALVQGNKIFELLFDATDLLQGSYFKCGLAWEKAICDAITVYLSNPGLRSYVDSSGPRSAAAIAKWFAERTLKIEN